MHVLAWARTMRSGGPRVAHSAAAKRHSTGTMRPGRRAVEHQDDHGRSATATALGDRPGAVG